MGATKNDAIKQREFEALSDRLNKNHLKLSGAKLLPELSLNKSSISASVSKITDAVTGGNVNPLEAFVYLKWMEEVAKKAREQILNESIAEANKYPEKEFKNYGCKIQLRSAAGRWDYSENEKIQALKEAVKEEEKDAQRAYHCFQKGETISNEDGEVIQPAKYTPGKDTLAITF